MATDKVVTGILHFNRVNGIAQTRTSGYHQTLTLFWLMVARRFLAELPAVATRLDRVNRFVAAFQARRDVFLEHYRPETIWSWDARLAWTEPDLKPL